MASSDPLRFEGLALCRGRDLRLMAANLSAERVAVAVRGLPAGVTVRALDETTFAAATADPFGFRAATGEPRPTRGGELTLGLNPHAYVRLDG